MFLPPRKAATLLTVLPLLVACHREAPAPVESMHYELGNGWHGTYGWFYPNEQFDYHATGLATIEKDQDSHVTADGEIWSASSMTGAHQTLQLPAIVNVRNLENGRIVRIRLNDRGPADQGRILAVSPKVAELLVMKGDTPVEITEDEQESHRLSAVLMKTPALVIQSAPVGEVQATSLNDGTSRVYGNGSSEADTSRASVAPLPTVWQQGAPGPHDLYVLVGIFSGQATAARVAARCNGTVLHTRDGTGLDWRVRSGPYRDVSQADEALDHTRLCGVEGARIIVE
ncbi:septal ring lytic transglycosylase RlpA family protein [Gluconobacter morbifer]|uniref:Rare lipoprotein A n=1 Tax=Gluconobacter morbifer G707 TaxID=1088869 RepID=G6XI64_9PROT|nr:RlpA-like double-psi beta-barrel domain-containing protein [Gluconobacter morbifer]EHH68504.1 rare lipoprotein A [Gluconobacter morbifer G707]